MLTRLGAFLGDIATAFACFVDEERAKERDGGDDLKAAAITKLLELAAPIIASWSKPAEPAMPPFGAYGMPVPRQHVRRANAPFAPGFINPDDPFGPLRPVPSMGGYVVASEREIDDLGRMGFGGPGMIPRPDLPPPGRGVLPMSASDGARVPKDQSIEITARAQVTAFKPTRLIIANAQDWLVNDIKIGNRSQLGSGSGPIPGEMFAASMSDSMISFDTAQSAMDVVIVATYIGDDKAGGAFYAAMLGLEPGRSIVSPSSPIAEREVVPLQSKSAIARGKTVEVIGRSNYVAFRGERVFISGAGTPGGHADWLINDIRVGTKGQFAQAGVIPGDVFAGDGGLDLTMDPAPTHVDIAMLVTYVGPNESAMFTGGISGCAADMSAN